MATKIIKAWIDGAIQEIEVEDIVSPEQPLSVEDRLIELEDKPIITDGNLLVGNGTDEMEEMTPEEVLSHINGASVVTLTTAEYEAMDEFETNANALYILTDGEDSSQVLYVEVAISEAGVATSLVGATPKKVFDAIDNGMNVCLYATISDTEVRYYHAHLRSDDKIKFVHSNSTETDTITIFWDGLNSLINRNVQTLSAETIGAANASDLTSHVNNSDIHVTADQINNALSQKSQVQIVTWGADE